MLGALFVSGMIIAVDSGSSKPLIFASVAGVPDVRRFYETGKSAGGVDRG